MWCQIIRHRINHDSSTFPTATLLLLLTIIPLALSADPAKPTIYRYTDHQGKVHFSDTPPTDRPFTTVIDTPVATTQWRELPKTTFSAKQPVTPKRRINNNGKQARHQHCQQLSSEIDGLEKQLNTRLKPQEFDQKKRQLSNKRWQYRKRC